MTQLPETKPKQIKLWKLVYSDYRSGVYLTTYADTLVFDTDGHKNILAAVRFGGYAEQVRGMADAIYGGGTVRAEIGIENIEFTCPVKQYRRDIVNDDIYPEATLLINDDGLQSESGESKEAENSKQEKLKELLRTSYIFCERDNPDRLFEEIDKKVSVPLIREFRDYLISELQKRNILKKLTVFSLREKFDAWKISLSADERNVISVVEDGLKSGIISIPNTQADAPTNDDAEIIYNPFDEVETVSGYLKAFGKTIAEKIKGQFNPLFDPTTENLSKEVLAVNSYIKSKTNYSLYDAQLATAESLKRRLDKSKSGMCVAECGSGKTKIGVTALHAHQAGKGRNKTFNIVLCPSHISKKWVREIEESLPNTYAVHIKSITDINKVHAAYVKGKKSCYVVITKEKARDGYMKRPSVRWNNRKNAFLCPHCHEPVMMEVIDSNSKYLTEADQFFFQKENSKNHKCDSCGGMLWTALLTTQQSEWVKIAGYGFIHRKFVHDHFYPLRDKGIEVHYQEKRRMKLKKILDNSAGRTENKSESPENGTVTVSNGDILDEDGIKIKFPKTFYDVKAVFDNPDGNFQAAAAYRRFPLSTYIKKKFKGRIDGLIVDELQVRPDRA